jgi:hypothetical protein
MKLCALLPLRPIAGGEGRGEVGGATASALQNGHLTRPRLWRRLLPLPRNAAARGGEV